VAPIQYAILRRNITATKASNLSTAQTALGTNQATALALSALINELTTVALNTGAKLPSPVPQKVVTVINAGVNAVLVYPFGAADRINALAVATGGFSIPAGKTATFTCSSSLQWYSLLSA
jgi:hypothetical protein